MKNFFRGIWFVLRLLLTFGMYVLLNHLTIVYENTKFYHDWIGDAGAIVYAPAITIIMGIALFWNNFHSIEILGANFELQKRVEKAMVEYETFREAVAPILRLELSRIERDGRMDMSLSVDELKYFVFNEIPVLRDNLNINDPESKLLFKIARARVIGLYRSEIVHLLSLITPADKKFSHPSFEVVDEFIDTGLQKDDRPNRFIETEVKVDIEGLKQYLTDNHYPWQSNVELIKNMNELSDYFVKAYKTAS